MSAERTHRPRGRRCAERLRRPYGNLYVDEGEQIIPTINGLVAAARDAGAAIVYTQDWHPETTPHFEKDGGIWPVHCVADSWGAQLHRDLEVDGPTIRKGTGGEDGYSGFTARDVSTGEDKPTDLQVVLQDWGIIHLVVVGLAQDVCVKETVLDARRLGYATTVPSAPPGRSTSHPATTGVTSTRWSKQAPMSTRDGPSSIRARPSASRQAAVGEW